MGESHRGTENWRRRKTDDAVQGRAAGREGGQAAGRCPHPLHRRHLLGSAGLVSLQAHLVAGQGSSSPFFFFFKISF